MDLEKLWRSGQAREGGKQPQSRAAGSPPGPGCRSTKVLCLGLEFCSLCCFPHRGSGVKDTAASLGPAPGQDPSEPLLAAWGQLGQCWLCPRDGSWPCRTRDGQAQNQPGKGPPAPQTTQKYHNQPKFLLESEGGVVLSVNVCVHKAMCVCKAWEPSKIKLFPRSELPLLLAQASPHLRGDAPQNSSPNAKAEIFQAAAPLARS